VGIAVSDNVSTAVIEHENRALLPNGALSSIISQWYFAAGTLCRELTYFFYLG